MGRDLIQLNEQIKKEAERLLQKNGLQTILAHYGRVHVTGSYALDLMTWRDLDIYLESDDLDEAKFFDLGKELVCLLQPVKMSFRNETIAKTAGLPPGLYWGIYLGDERGGSWKIDIWALSKQECDRRLKYCGDLAKRVTASSRLKILDIKSQCWNDPHYRKLYTSNDIYSAVLEGSARDLESFKKYLQNKFSQSQSL